MMNTARHASNILEAWRYRDDCGLGTALERAAASYTDSEAGSHFESEREEMLQSIVEHLRGLSRTNTLPEYSRGSGAVTLLSHLSSEARLSETSEGERWGFSTNELKLGTERATCTIEVDCRPRG